MRGLIGSSKRVLSGTKNEDKVKAINEGVKILEEFLEKFDLENRSKYNFAYLPSSVITAFPAAKHSLVKEFVSVYSGKANGNYKHLRTLYPRDDDSISWDIIRNKEVKKIKEKIAANDSKLFNEDGSPSAEHLDLIHWAYSPQADKVKNLAGGDKKKDDKKRKSRHSSSSDSSSDDDDGTPAKKQKS